MCKFDYFFLGEVMVKIILEVDVGGGIDKI